MIYNTVSVAPHLACRNSADAPAFYEKAFGATILDVEALPDGRLMHAALAIQGAKFHVSDEFPEYGGKCPESLGGTPVVIHLQVPDCDAVYQRAVDAGCTVAMPLEDMFWGDRYGQVLDPFGHKWAIATTVREMDPEAMKQFAESMGAKSE